jgi:GNAT superfamily N-acetyltransferase
VAVGTEPAVLPALKPAGEVRIRPVRAEDLTWTGELQREALPHGFFTQLGPRFLRAYQQTFLDSPFGIALAAEHEGEPAGFLLGVADGDAHRGWVVRTRRLRLAALGAVCLVRRPPAAARFLRTRLGHYLWTLRSGGRRAPERNGDPALPLAAAVLTHVAVLPGKRRSGAGRALAEAFVDEARERGAGRARLTTLRDDRGAEEFWKSLGWVPGKAIEDDEDRLHRVLERKL